MSHERCAAARTSVGDEAQTSVPGSRRKRLWLSVRRDTGGLSVREPVPAVETALPERCRERDAQRAAFLQAWRGGAAPAATPPCA